MEKVRSLVDQTRVAALFCGGSRNHQRYMDLFDKVFVLDDVLDTLKRRLVGRTDDELGATPNQWAVFVSFNETNEDIRGDAMRIVGVRPVASVIDEILLNCGLRLHRADRRSFRNARRGKAERSARLKQPRSALLASYRLA